MTDQPPAVTRAFSSLPEDEQLLIKMFYVNGVQSVGQIAKTWNLNPHALSQVIYREGWKQEKDEVPVLAMQNASMHLKFMQRVFGMMENIQQGYEDLMLRHQFHDSFEGFPFENYYQFLEVYSKSVNLLGSVKAVSQEMNLTLNQTNVQQNNYIDTPAGDDEFIAPLDSHARHNVRKLMEAIVLNVRPPKTKEISAQEIEQNKPDPAQGQYR